ncbi:MAG: Rpn family recombination-promoting nuclease/putative transposase [Phormidesmis sp.]
MFDNVCKFLIETFPTDFSTWLLGEPIDLSTLNPSELSLEPIRADALILLQAEAVVLHVEFQTKPDSTIPFRMLDYRVRVYRRFPAKTIRQVVVYLRQSQSDLVQQTNFELENTQHQFEVIRLWEQPSETFLTVPGLLPFAVLGKTNDREATLRQVAEQLETITPGSTQSSLVASTSILSGLVLQGEVIRQILRSETMQESVIYQEIKAEGIRGKDSGGAADC